MTAKQPKRDFFGIAVALEIIIKSKENQLCALTAVIAMRRVTNAFLSADGCEKNQFRMMIDPVDLGV